MEIFVCTDPGAARDVLRLVGKPRSSPVSGEVPVQVFATGISPSGTKRRSGQFSQPFKIEEVTPHSDAAGIVDATGIMQCDRDVVADR